MDSRRGFQHDLKQEKLMYVILGQRANHSMSRHNRAAKFLHCKHAARPHLEFAT